MNKKLLFKTWLLLALMVLGVSNVWADTYTKITSTSELVAGKQYIFVYEDDKVAMGALTTSGTTYGKTASVTLSNDSATPGSDVNILTLGWTAEGWTFYTSNESKYISWSSGNSLTTTDAVGNASKWTVSISDGNATITNVGTTTRKLQYNSSSPRFACYTGTQQSIQIYKKDAPAQTITVVSNNEDYGTVSLLGTTITATPKTGYRVVAGDGGYTVTTGTAEVVNNGDNTFTVTPSTDCTVRINFEAIPTHEAKFSVNGAEVSSSVVEEGADIVFPAEDPADLGGKKFVGWAAATISGTTNVEPTFVSSAKMGATDVTYYAVYATAADGGAATATLTANSGWTSYQNKDFTDDKGNTWTANCSGQSLSGTYYYGLNGGTSYLSSPVFPGNVTAVKVTAHNGSSKETRTFTLKKGNTEVGTISVAPSAAGDELTASLNGTAFNQFDMTSSAALQFHTIAVTYSVVSYSAYCTSVTVPVTITAAGYATYCSAYALNFKGVAGLTAYKAAMVDNNNEVTFTPVTKVPAGAGVLLKAEPGEYKVPVTASADELTGNLLVGVSEDGKTVDGSDPKFSYYVLRKQNGKTGFYKIVADGYKLKKGTAYLKVEVAGSNAKTFIGLDGTETAVEAVAAQEQFAGELYNLQGQRVGNDYKGIVIVNGKKVIR